MKLGEKGRWQEGRSPSCEQTMIGDKGYAKESVSLTRKRSFSPDIFISTDIPVNQYAKTLDEEKALYSKDDMMRIYRDMAYYT